MKRAHPMIERVTTRDGRVVEFLETSTQHNRVDRLIIDSRINLHKFCDQYVKNPLKIFIETLPQAYLREIINI